MTPLPSSDADLAAPSFQVIFSLFGWMGRSPGASEASPEVLRGVYSREPIRNVVLLSAWLVTSSIHCRISALPTSGKAPSVSCSVPVVRLRLPTPYDASRPRKAPEPSSRRVYQRPATR